MSVCLLTNLTYGASVRPGNTVTYSEGNEGQGICLKRLHSRVMQRNTSEKANMLLFPLTRGQLPPLDTQRSTRGYPMILNNIQPCPKMPTDAPSPCWSEKTAPRVYSYKCEAWPISAHAYLHSTQERCKRGVCGVGVVARGCG